MKLFFRLFSIVMILTLLMAVPGRSFAQSGTIVRVQPETTVVDPGDGFTVTVLVENVQDLYAFDITVTYDPAILSADQIQLGAFLEPGIVIKDETVNETGYVRYAMTQVSPALPKSGSGALITIAFTALSGGQSALTLQMMDLVEHDSYDLIPCDGVDGVVQVNPAKNDNNLYIPLFISG